VIDFILAAPQGFEPRYADPESAVLPLNEGAAKDENRLRGRFILILWAWVKCVNTTGTPLLVSGSLFRCKIASKIHLLEQSYCPYLKTRLHPQLITPKPPANRSMPAAAGCP
jgi:hypothetical protein